MLTLDDESYEALGWGSERLYETHAAQMVRIEGLKRNLWDKKRHVVAWQRTKADPMLLDKKRAKQREYRRNKPQDRSNRKESDARYRAKRASRSVTLTPEKSHEAK